MITCRRCTTDHPDGTDRCECGADLAVDGIAVGDGAMGAAFPDLGAPIGGDDPFAALPPQQAASPPRPAEAPPTPPSGPAPPPPTPGPAQPSAPGGASYQGQPPVQPPRRPARPGRMAMTPKIEQEESSIIDPELARELARKPDEPTANTPAVLPGAPPPPATPARVGEVGRATNITPHLPDVPDHAPERFRPDRPREAVELSRSCTTCGRALVPGRRFCDCSAPVAQPVVDVADDEPDTVPAAKNWFRRLMGTGVSKRADNRTWSQRARDQGARKGMRYASAISAQTRFARIGMAVLAGGGALVLLGPLKGEARRVPELFVTPSHPLIDERTIGGSFPSELGGNDDESILEEALQIAWPFGDDLDRPQDRADETDVEDCEGSFDDLVADRVQRLDGAPAALTGATEPSAAVDAMIVSGTFDDPVDLYELWFQVAPSRGEAPVTFPQASERPAQIALGLDGADGEISCRLLPVQDSTERQIFRIEDTDVEGFRILVTEVWDETVRNTSDVLAPVVYLTDVSWRED